MNRRQLLRHFTNPLPTTIAPDESAALGRRVDEDREEAAQHRAAVVSIIRRSLLA